MAKRKIISNYEGKRKGEQGSIFIYEGKTKVSYGFILELPSSPNGKRNRVEKGGFNTEFDAVLAKRKLEKTSGFNIRKNIEIISLEKFFNNIFIPYLQNQSIEDSTIRGYLSNFKDAQKYFGNINLVDITKKDFEGYKNYLLSLNSLENSTINTKLIQMTNIMNIAVELDYIEINQFKGRGLKVKKTLNKPYSNDNIKDIFNLIEDYSIIKDRNKYFIPCFIALNTGARQGEILALKWEDIDFNEKTIKINKSMKRDINNNIIIGSTKTNTDRVVPLNNILEKELLNHKLEQKKNKLKFGNKYIDSNYVCTYENGKIVTINTLSALRSVMNNNCIDFNFHRFRHTFATRAVQSDIHIKVLQDILGHSDISTTMEYYASTDNVQRKSAAEQIAETFNL